MSLFTGLFIGLGIVAIFAFCIGYGLIAAGLEKDENNNFIPDSWEFWNKKKK